VTPNCPLIEFLPAALAGPRLRLDLTECEFELVDGRLPLPKTPGLGVSLSESALAEFRAP